MYRLDNLGRSKMPLATVAFLAVAACVAAALFAATARGAAAKAPRKMTVYSIATQEQFLNHQDDRARGTGNNPFGNFKDTTTPTKEAGNGPAPGDRTVITFKLFSNSNLKQSVGSATFICEYGAAKNGMCQAAYVLSGGMLLGTGFFNFNASSFQIAIAGGTGKYRGAKGTILATPGKGRTQRLAFQFG
jgi:hypothetical protein